MSQAIAQIFMFFVIPLLGVVLVFVVNPRKVRLRWRLVALVASSLFVASLVLLVLALGREDWRAHVPRALLVGPFLFLWLGGIHAIGLFARASYRSVRRRCSRTDHPAS